LAYNGGLGLSTNLDGANPYGEPILVNKMLCTTACFGGSVGDGALFALSLAPSVPPLIIQPSTSKSMVISWPSSETGWTLQQSADLADPDGWSISTLPVSDDGANKSVTLQPSGETQFFRLKK
jgi:hypothetical protein